MEASILNLERQLEEVKGTLTEIKVENAALKKELSGNRGAGAEENGESSCWEGKTLREVVEGIATEVSVIGAHVSRENDGPRVVMTEMEEGEPHLLYAHACVVPFPESAPEIPVFTPIQNDGDNEVDNQILLMTGADLNIQRNGEQHHTSKYSVMRKPLNKGAQLVVRRGQEFSLELHLVRPYVKGSDGLKLTFFLAHKASKKSYNGIVSTDDGTRQRSKLKSIIIVYVADEKSGESRKGWYGYVHTVKGSVVSIQVKSPAGCPIGHWMLDVELFSRVEKKYYREYAFTQPMYILFNPWCPEDDTYYPDEEHLKSYVLAEYGTIFNMKESGRSWQYEQFEEQVLDCALYLLRHNYREGPLSVSDRGNVVKVCRRLTSAINSNDAGGVLRGNWTGKYDGGRAPSKWEGSKEILQQYYQKKSPVLYGQCWVFAGVLNTVCRALGIPSRVVTNYSSAHESRDDNGDYYFSIDFYYKPGEHKYLAGGDSIWNFHVWNEAWMKRGDLQGDYSRPGWQAIDGTPQERSRSIYQMGPAPVEACKRGDVKIPYDVDFLFGEVNADIVHYECRGSSGSSHSKYCRKHKLRSLYSTDKVGQRISTEDVKIEGKRVLLTEEYKYPEGAYKHEISGNYKGSGEEREAMGYALEISGLDRKRVEEKKQVPDVLMNAEIQETFIGEPLNLQIGLENKGSEHHSGSAWVQIYTTTAPPYVKDVLVWEKEFDFDLAPGKQDMVSLNIAYESYSGYLRDLNKDLRIEYSAVVNNTKIAYFGKSLFCFSEPDITMKVPESLQEGKRFEVEVTFQNSYPFTLQDGSFKIYGTSCRLIQRKKELMSPINPGESYTETFELEPLKSTHVLITAKFASESTQATALGKATRFVYPA